MAASETRLVCRLRSESAQKHLLTESALNLEKAIEIGISMDLSTKEAGQLSTNGKLARFPLKEKEFKENVINVTKQDILQQYWS